MLVNFVFFIVGLVLETLLFWRGVKANLWRYYPLFYAYIGYELVRTVVLFTIMQIRPEHYAMAFWLSQLGVLLFQILVAWEVFRQTFASALFVRRAGSLLLSVIFVVLAATYFFRGDHSGSVFGRLEIETDLFISARISDLAVVPYRQDQSLRLEFWGSDVRNHTTEGDTRWVNYNTSHSSSRSTAS